MSFTCSTKVSSSSSTLLVLNPMPKYDERFAQEAQEEDYMRHMAEEMAMFSEHQRIAEPKFIGIAINAMHDVIVVRALSKEELYSLADQSNLKVLQTFEPKQVI